MDLKWAILLLFSASLGVAAEKLSDFTVLYRYSRFSSTSVFRYDVPVATKQATWGFQAENKFPDSCDSVNVSITLQHGSLPLINPLGEKIPDNFYINQMSDSKAVFTTIANNITLVASMNNPTPGPWYGVAHLPKSDGKMLPADLFVNCVYRLRTWFSSDVETDIQDLQVGVNKSVTLEAQGKQLFRFYVPLDVYYINITLSHCHHGNNTDCPIVMATRGEAFPGRNNSTRTIDCSQETESCMLDVFYPRAGVWNYLELSSNSEETVEADMSIVFTDCGEGETEYPGSQQCQLTSLLDRYSYNAKFHTKFAMIDDGKVEDVIVSLSENKSRIVPFYIEDGEDNGGSLVITGEIKDRVSVQDSDINVEANFCVMRGVVPQNMDILMCNTGYHGNATTGQGQDNKFKVIVPYPRSGHWFVGTMMRCYQFSKSNDSKEYRECGAESVNVNVTVTTEGCVEGGCSKHGDCINFLNGHVLFTTCSCDDGWRGYDCSDGSDLDTDREQLAEVLLLTLSNIFFLPAIIIAAYRRHYVEALIYTYNMIFSAFYHACDGGRRESFTLCILPLRVLSTCDFVASASSIWITLVAMSRPPLQWKGFIQMFGPLGILVGVLYRKTSAYLFLIPFALGFLLLLISWVCRCCYRHKCYPSKMKYLLCLLPGWLLAAGGLAIFTFLESEDNYLYTHSAWHACMALSVCLLLPPRDSRVYKVKERNGLALGSTYQPIRTSEGNNYVI